jgi:hypothetical protein
VQSNASILSPQVTAYRSQPSQLMNGTHYNVYSGVDYEMNERAHIYFNLFYHDLDYAFSIGTTEVQCCYVKARNPIMRALLKRLGGRFFQGSTWNVRMFSR